jgi:ribonuclease HI
MKQTNEVTIFTDGSSRNNPGSGGWGSVIAMKLGARSQKPEEVQIIELGGGEKNTTNNRMELMAAIQGLKKVQSSKFKVQNLSQVTIYTDSSYVINGITKWVKGWKKNGWQTKTKQSVLNRDLWEELDALNEKLPVKWNYVGGHVGILGNERCDHIATAFADGMKIKLYEGTLAGYDLPDILNISLDEARQTKKSSDSAHSRAKAYSYVSMVQGVIETHHTWGECEKRVKGVNGAKFRKAVSSEDEAQIMAEFEAI